MSAYLIFHSLKIPRTSLREQIYKKFMVVKFSFFKPWYCTPIKSWNWAFFHLLYLETAAIAQGVLRDSEFMKINEPFYSSNIVSAAFFVPRCDFEKAFQKSKSNGTESRNAFIWISFIQTEFVFFSSVSTNIKEGFTGSHHFPSLDLLGGAIKSD